MRRPTPATVLAVVLLLAGAASFADEVDEQLAVIGRAGSNGAGSVAARAACDWLSMRDAAILPRLLRAMQTTNPVAANWYRHAYETIVERELAADSGRFPQQELQTFVRDQRNLGRVRRLAMALCERLEPGFAAELVSGLLDDPEFRDDAVDAALAAGVRALDEGDSETARDRFRTAFEHARGSEQVVRAAGRLAGLREEPDIVGHLGLVVDWRVVGPFGAPQFTGFAREFPPEARVDLTAEYVGQDGRTLQWQQHTTVDPLGLVNLVQALAPAKEAVGYAYAELEAPREMKAQLRCGADDNCTVWLNDEKVFARSQWLNGIRFDRFVAPVTLRRGTNRVLVKICQGPQHKNPDVPNNWSFQLRFCDESGTGVGLRSLATDGAEAK